MNNQVICMKGSLVVLRPVDPEQDLASCYRWINDPEVNQFTKQMHPFNKLAEKEYLEELHKRRHDVVFAINTIEDNKFIGVMGLHGIRGKDRTATTGAMIGEKKFWSKGYGTDAKMQLLHYAFHDLNLRRINSSVIAFNDRSRAYLLKTGYQEEGVRREMYFRNGRYWDQINFGLFRRGFEPIWKRYLHDPTLFLEHQHADKQPNYLIANTA